MRTNVLCVGFDSLTMEEAVDKALLLIQDRQSAYIVTPNPEIVWLCREDAPLQEIIEEAALVLPDGIGVVYGAKILGRTLKSKVAGIDFAENVIARLAQTGGSIYLLGAKPGVAMQAAKNLTNKYPGLVVAGTADGYFKEDGPVIEKINTAQPDFLLVCLGAPKQERWMAANKDKLAVGLMAGLGGSLDVFAGTVTRAPKSWQKLHLEWLHRLLKEPTRITRMIKLPLFIFAVIGQRIKGQ